LPPAQEKDDLMPNAANVEAPINVLGIGRSGTTMLCAAIASALKFQNCAETATAVFATYAAHLQGLSDDRTGGGTANSILAIGAVRGALIGAMPTDKSGWVQKVAGIPKNLRWEDVITPTDREYGGDFAFPYTWYWTVLERCFPRSINILSARNPLDIVASRQSMSGWQPKETWRDFLLMSKMMLHPRARVDAVFSLNRYHESAEAEIARFDASVPFHVRHGFEFKPGHVFAPDRQHDYRGKFGRQDAHAQVLRDLQPSDEEKTLVRAFEQRFGLPVSNLEITEGDPVEDAERDEVETQPPTGT
jgi:hypothetical protein